MLKLQFDWYINSYLAFFIFHFYVATLLQLGVVVLLIGCNFLLTNQKHYQDLGSVTSSVWNFCACYLEVVFRGLKWRPRETSAVFSG